MFRIRERLFQPIENTVLAFFRVVFGGIMLWEVWRYFEYGWVDEYFVDVPFMFKYFGFGWVLALPGDGPVYLFYAVAVLSACIMVGFLYRLVMPLFFITFSYVFLLDQTHYLNHFYLVSLFSFLMIFLPLNHTLSVDAWLRPGMRTRVAPAWTLWTLRGQMAVAYIGGGIAKLNLDWLRGEPMRLWMSERTYFPILGQWFTEEPLVYLFSYGGLLLDLLVVPLILWRRTRLFALALAITFHLSNSQLFGIGIFPYFSIAATLIFLPWEWFAAVRDALGTRLALPEMTATPPSTQRLILGVLGAYFVFQVLFPLRHFFYPGNVSWTEEGHKFAWHMRLRDKAADARFFVTTDATTQEVMLSDYLRPRQISQMSDRPEMLLQFAHYLRDQHGGDGVEVRASVLASLNNRAPQLLVDPSVDLGQQREDIFTADWLLPLVQPLKGGKQSLLLLYDEDSLHLVNMTRIPFPLTGLMLGKSTPGDLWGLDSLPPESCVALYHADVIQPRPVACEEQVAYWLDTGEAAFWRDAFTVTDADGRSTLCAGDRCVVRLR
jgi:vitamin K-dependent gamma-carboxylase